ncbi:hypothetical protein ASE14_11520 [Agromyces sp. Root81]|uniref:hypothetical protein n=1 Tax=Agromyces sp. Root81 TaxID=1736601 RepID=UPI0006F51387|nr:hypothetical protein [Agromyces sp. Root81]KRC61487.1 hypothetical protein ASE14_11520 [Agromyces sp. Root81]
MPDTTAPAQRGIAFSMLFPPGWREFRADASGEAELTELATAGARQAGRADVVLVIRQHVHRMFDGLRRRRAIGVHLPVETLAGGALPVSLTVVPVRVATGSTLARTVHTIAGVAGVEELPVDGATWYRWEEHADELDGDRSGASTSLHYVVPRPGGDGEAGLQLIYALVALAEDRGGEEARALERLGHGIIGTFQWGPPQ